MPEMRSSALSVSHRQGAQGWFGVRVRKDGRGARDPLCHPKMRVRSRDGKSRRYSSGQAWAGILYLRPAGPDSATDIRHQT